MRSKERTAKPTLHGRKGATARTLVFRLPVLPAEQTRTQNNKHDSLLDDVIDAEGAAMILKIHPVTVRLKAAAGQIPGRQIGNRWRFSRTRLHEWLRAA
jgi:excisionase family DNA binding protein